MSISRRSFLAGSALGAGMMALGANSSQAQQGNLNIEGFGDTKTSIDRDQTWKPVSDRKIRMGLVGYGVCQFASSFSLQDHPNVELVAVSDLIPDRCDALAKVTKCKKTYPSLEEMVKDDKIEAIFVATDAPSHARHCMEVMKHGKHVATAVPATFDVEEADMLLEMVKKTGLNYMMFETSVYHDRLYAMRTIYNAGGFGKLVYSEGEYYHYSEQGIDSYNNWRVGLPPMYYLTHASAYYVGVSGGSFTEVSCLGRESHLERLQKNTAYNSNRFGTEIAMFRTSEGGMSRMARSGDSPGYYAETGRVSGEIGTFWNDKFAGIKKSEEIVSKLNLKKPALPPGVNAGGHGGSHGYLGHEFVMSILENRKPLVDVVSALNMTIPGIIAHQSALKNGEYLKIPQYKW